MFQPTWLALIRLWWMFIMLNVSANMASVDPAMMNVACCHKWLRSNRVIIEVWHHSTKSIEHERVINVQYYSEHVLLSMGGFIFCLCCLQYFSATKSTFGFRKESKVRVHIDGCRLLLQFHLIPGQARCNRSDLHPFSYSVLWAQVSPFQWNWSVSGSGYLYRLYRCSTRWLSLINVRQYSFFLSYCNLHAQSPNMEIINHNLLWLLSSRLSLPSITLYLFVSFHFIHLI